jgi:CheY-like chemotaxis protein
MSGKSRETPTVLVVEGDGEIRSMMARLVEARGFRVVVSVDYEGALEVARRERPDLILANLDLPTMEQLRGSEELGRIRIAAVDPDSAGETAGGRVTVVEDFDRLKELL